MKKGLLVIYSGPSAVGKDTILNKLLSDKDLNLALSVSMTTRKPRSGEKEGVEYFFVSEERFKQAIDKDELLEYAEYVDHYYGTPLKYVEENRSIGKNVVLVIEMKGRKKVIEKIHDNVISICIVPPSLDELEKRMRKRNKDDDESIKKRLAKAQEELKHTEDYDYIVVNDNLDKAANDVRKIILDEVKKNQA